MRQAATNHRSPARYTHDVYPGKTAASSAAVSKLANVILAYTRHTSVCSYHASLAVPERNVQYRLVQCERWHLELG